MTALYLAVFAVFALCLCTEGALSAGIMSNRNLTDFTNDNGSPPSGQDTQIDDTSAIRSALAAGPGIVHVGPGYYRWSHVMVPSGVTVVGSGPATVVRPAGEGYIFEQVNVTDWAIRNIVLDGEAKDDWHQRKDAGIGGISTRGCGKHEIVGVTVRNFNGMGIHISHSNLASFMGGGAGNLDRITSYGNYAGICFDTRGEYLNATSLSCFNNIIGCAIHAGNVKIMASNFGANVDGLIVEDHENGSHGSVTNCLMNHNERYALFCKNVQNGMVFDGCCLFYGSMRLENCKGVNIANGIIGCSVSTIGTSVNRIAGNYIIAGPEHVFDFAPPTIVQDNFTDSGPWEKNGHMRDVTTAQQ